MCAVALSLIVTTVLLRQASIEQVSKPVDPKQRFDGFPAPTLAPPDEVIKDLAGHAWSQLESKINESLEENDTLIVWVVDRTASMSARRLELADRIVKAFGDQPNDS